MQLSTEVGVLLGYALGILGIYIICYIFLVPLKVFAKICLNSVIGFGCIILYNMLGNSVMGLHIDLNLITSVVVGVLGVPGFILLAILSL